MLKFKSMPTVISLYRDGDSPIFGESVTRIELDDEAGGIFLKITQDPNDFGPGGVLRFDFEEIEIMVKAIEFLKSGIETGNGDFS